MNKQPIAIVKERFQDKAGLIKAVKELATEDLWIDRLDTDKGLECVSNKKLLHLHALLSTVKQKYGSRSKLIEAVVALQGRGKDADYKAGLARFSTPRLFDLVRVGERQAKAAN